MYSSFFRTAWLLALVLLMVACGQGDLPVPKPRGYPRIVFPERTYQPFDTAFCAFTFEYPTYARISQDTAFFEERPTHPCWFNLDLPDFNGQVHFSYYPIGGEKSLPTLIKDAFEMADWHNKRANYIEEIPIDRPGNVGGLVFQMEGPAASSFQFFVTDSTQHFLRGALYFNTQARPDSLAPIISYVREDLLHLLETFSWQ